MADYWAVLYPSTTMLAVMLLSTAVGAVLLAGHGDALGAAIWVAAGSVAAGLDRRPRGGLALAVIGVAYVATAPAVLAALRQDEAGGLWGVIFLLSVVWSAGYSITSSLRIKGTQFFFLCPARTSSNVKPSRRIRSSANLFAGSIHMSLL